MLVTPVGVCVKSYTVEVAPAEHGQSHLHGCALRRDGCEPHDVAEVDGDRVKGLGLHRLPSLKLLRHGAAETKSKPIVKHVCVISQVQCR